MATSGTQTTKTIGSQVNALADIVAKYIAALQQSDSTINNTITANKNDVDGKINNIIAGTTALTKVTLKNTGSGSSDTTHTISVVNGVPKYDTDNFFVLKPLVVTPTTTELTVAENTVYKYANANKLSSLSLTITNSTLESRIYFTCATDDFEFNVTGGMNLLLNIEPDDLEWDADTTYCVSVLDGVVSVAPAYSLR